MIDVVISYDKTEGFYKVYEPTTETLLVTTSLAESFLRLSEHLNQKGLIPGDILGSDQIRYHIDSPTFIAMVESNVNLLKRLNQSPTGFMISGQRFGQSQQSSKKPSNDNKRKKFKSGNFSKSGFSASYKKFGSND